MPLKDVIAQIATENDLKAAVDEDIGSFLYPWIGQQNEIDPQFLRRLERRHNGLLAIKSGKLIFAKRGSGRSASGDFVGTVEITPGLIIQGSCSFEANDRTKYSKVVAYYQDRTRLSGCLSKLTRTETAKPSSGLQSHSLNLPKPTKAA